MSKFHFHQSTLVSITIGCEVYAHDHTIKAIPHTRDLTQWCHNFHGNESHDRGLCDSLIRDLAQRSRQ